MSSVPPLLPVPCQPVSARNSNSQFQFLCESQSPSITSQTFKFPDLGFIFLSSTPQSTQTFLPYPIPFPSLESLVYQKFGISLLAKGCNGFKSFWGREACFESWWHDKSPFHFVSIIPIIKIVCAFVIAFLPFPWMSPWLHCLYYEYTTTGKAGIRGTTQELKGREEGC